MRDKYTLEKILLLASLAIAWGFDFLFWEKAIGISFAVFVVVALAVGFWLTRQANLAPARQSLWLLAPIGLLATMAILRAEPFSVFFARIVTLLSMALLAVSYTGGRLAHYGFADYLAKLPLLPFSGLRAFRAHSAQRRKGTARRAEYSLIGSIGLGLLIALPLLIVFGTLLSSADPIFGTQIADLLGYLRLDRLLETFWRTFTIGVIGILLLGVYSYSLFSSADETLIGQEKPLFRPFLDFPVSATILLSIESLFGMFVLIQFQYFFGGAANIHLAGLTYAEYARQGFGELMVVAAISVGLFVMLSQLTSHKIKKQDLWFSRLGILLFAQVAIILASAYKRLLLYEGAYGFTQIRTLAHVFMIWLGLLLIAFVVLEARGRHRAYTNAALLAAFGFTATLSLINVDAFIVRANVQRLEASQELDLPHLAWLSTDAAPRLLGEFERIAAKGNDENSRLVLATLACHAYNHNEYEQPEAWQSFRWSGEIARRAWAEFRSSNDFERVLLIQDDDRGHSVGIDGEIFECSQETSFD